MHRLITWGVLTSALAASGCSSLTIVGVSDAEGAQSTIPQSTAAPRTAIKVAAISGELLMSDSVIGDIDGDGYDDIMLGGSQVSEFADNSAIFTSDTSISYLFYGRPDFAASYVSTDADATFETGNAFARAGLGDINGDGLADMALGDLDGFELVFGTKQRWSGHRAKLSTGPVVTYPATLDAAGIHSTRIESIHGVGDLNGDGKDEFAIRLVAPASDNGAFYGASLTEYIIAGREDGWPRGAWDPSFAAAQLGSERETHANHYIHHVGDFDGDGYGDLLTYGGDDPVRLFYGEPDLPSGTLSQSQSDAELDFDREAAPSVIGDLDGDGTDDIALVKTNELQILYGSRVRYSGRAQLQGELTSANRGPYFAASAGDLNGDGHRDLLFHAYDEERRVVSWDSVSGTDGLYVRYGTAERLGVETLFQPVGYPAPEALHLGGYAALPVGDVDGDGSTDLMFSAGGGEDPRKNPVYLLPGSVPAPD